MPSVGSGVGGFYSSVAESTYGTYVAPTHAYEVESASIKRSQSWAKSATMANSRLGPNANFARVVGEQAAGSIVMAVPTTNFGFWLAQATGSANSGTSNTPVQQAATTAYLSTHAYARANGVSHSAQVNVPDTQGVAHPYTAVGCKVTDLELSCVVDGLLKATPTVDVKQLNEAQTIVVPSYAAATGTFGFDQMAVSIGAFGSEAAVTGVTGVTVKLTRPLNTNMKYANNSGLKSEPVQNGLSAITGTIEADMFSKADFADRFNANGNFSLIWTFTGATIASTYHYTLSVAIPHCKLEGESPDLANLDVTHMSLPFVAYEDLSHALCTISYTSTDTAL